MGGQAGHSIGACEREGHSHGTAEPSHGQADQRQRRIRRPGGTAETQDHCGQADQQSGSTAQRVDHPITHHPPDELSGQQHREPDAGRGSGDIALAGQQHRRPVVPDVLHRDPGQSHQSQGSEDQHHPPRAGCRAGLRGLARVCLGVVQRLRLGQEAAGAECHRQHAHRRPERHVGQQRHAQQRCPRSHCPADGRADAPAGMHGVQQRASVVLLDADALGVLCDVHHGVTGAREDQAQQHHPRAAECHPGSSQHQAPADPRRAQSG